MKLFKKYGISSAVGGTEDDEIYWDEESDSSENNGKGEIKDDTSDTDSDKEFLAFYDV